MTVAVQGGRVRPRVVWYLLPVSLFVVAIVLFVLAITTIAHLVNGDLVRVRPAASTGGGGSGQFTGPISVPDNGRTVWTETKGSDATCVLEPRGGGRTIELDTFPFEFEFPHSGRSYYAVGVTPDSTPAGTYRLGCSDTADGERFATGPRIDTTALATRFIWGIGLPIVMVIVGAILAIVLVVRRHNAKSRLRAEEAATRTGPGGWTSGHGAGSSPPPPPPPQSS